MILDELSNLALYKTALGDLVQVQAFLSSPDTPSLPTGRVDLKNGVYALVQEFTTDAPEAERKWEAHRRFIDVQCVLSGDEAMGWAPVAELVEPTPYNPDKDVVLALTANKSCEVFVRAGQFAVFFPEDAHRPCRSVRSPVEVRKIVFKVPTGA